MLTPQCAECGGTNVSVLCKVWLDFTNGTPELDPNDGEYAAPFAEPGNAICRSCEHNFSFLAIAEAKVSGTQKDGWYTNVTVRGIHD